METFLAVGLMIFSLGYFSWSMRDIRRSYNEDHDRTLNTAREFGFEDSKLRKEGIIHRPKK